MHHSRGSQKKKLWYDDGDHHPPLFLITWGPLKKQQSNKNCGSQHNQWELTRYYVRKGFSPFYFRVMKKKFYKNVDLKQMSLWPFGGALHKVRQQKGWSFSQKSTLLRSTYFGTYIQLGNKRIERSIEWM